MTIPEKPHGKSTSAWNWPVEWAVDEKFWREVATRTIAGILTLTLLGAPGLIYAMSAGVLKPDQAAPVLIGMGILVGTILVYIVAQLIVRGVAKRAILKELNRAAIVASIKVPLMPPITIAFARQVLEADSEGRAALLKQFSAEIQKEVLATARHAAISSIVAGFAVAIVGLVAALSALFK